MVKGDRRIKMKCKNCGHEIEKCAEHENCYTHYGIIKDMCCARLPDGSICGCINAKPESKKSKSWRSK
jgi:hypothetical protein